MSDSGSHEVHVTLDQMLELAGRLDDSRDFDAPRERFRRFLREYVTDVGRARTLIDQARYAPDDQHRRAVQDLVALLGRFLGFDVDLGAPPRGTGAPAHHGMWHAPGRLRVVVEVGTAAPRRVTLPPDLAAAAADEEQRAMGTPVVGLFVATTPSAAPHPLEGGQGARPTRAMPLGDLLTLADLAASGRLASGDVARMLEFGIPVDFVAGLLERPASGPMPAEAVPDTAPSARQGSGYWMASVPPDYATTPEEFLELVVARRHVFGVTDRGTVVGTVQAGDGICFYLPGKGVVGHAWVASMTDGLSDLRDARRFRQVLRLERLALHLAKPVRLDLETEVRLRAAPAAANRQAQTLIEISAESFRALSVAAVRPRGNDADDASDREGRGMDSDASRDSLSG